MLFVRSHHVSTFLAFGLSFEARSTSTTERLRRMDSALGFKNILASLVDHAKAWGRRTLHHPGGPSGPVDAARFTQLTNLAVTIPSPAGKEQLHMRFHMVSLLQTFATPGWKMIRLY